MEKKFEIKNLILFFVLTFIFTWSLWIPTAMISQGFVFPKFLEEFFVSPYNPAAFGPLFAALVLSYYFGGKNDLFKLLRRGFDYHFEKKWFIPIFFLFPAMNGVALLISVLSGEILPNLTVISNPLTILVAFFYILFLGGPLAEEFGWRGYALGRLQLRWNALISSIMLGLIWGAWHLPLFFINGTIQSMVPIWAFMVLIICGTILFTWIYNNTNGSIMAALIFHTMNNLAFFIFPIMETSMGGLYLLVINIVVVLSVIIIWGPVNLSKTKRVFI
ncbi:MAG: type II CAAX endopeptidase family protein [Methanobacteriaceae archaeon]